MAQTSYPFDTQVTTEDQYSAFFSRMLDTGVLGEIGDADLECYGDSSGMQVKIRTGSAAVRGHFYTNTSEVTQAIAASGGSTRYDWVVLKLDPSVNSIVIAVVQGTPGAGIPSLTQGATGIYHMPLALVQIDAGVITIASNKVTDKRPWGGTRIGAWSTDLRPSAPVTGQMGYNTTTAVFEYWTGSAWSNLLPEQKKIKSGVITAAFGAGALNKVVAVNWPVGTFPTTPHMLTTIVGSAGNTGRCAARPTVFSATSGQIVVYNEDGQLVTGNVLVYWVAVYEP